MRSVPRVRASHAERLRACFQEPPAGVADRRPVPADFYAECFRLGLTEEGNEIDSQAELVRGLPRSRFTGAFTMNAYLPSGAAECLEDLEAELRAAGLITPDQILVQTSRDGRKFRVKERRPSVDGILVHDDHLSLLGPRAQAHAEGPNLSRPRRKVPNPSGEAPSPRPVHIKRGRRPAL